MGRRGYGSGESSAIRVDSRGLSNIDQRIRNIGIKLVTTPSRPAATVVDLARCALSLVRAQIMAGSSSKPMSARSVQSHDWDARATEVIAQARKMPLGQRRSDALDEAGRLRIAAEMNRWLPTK
jgi:hypothetical protein